MHTKKHHCIGIIMIIRINSCRVSEICWINPILVGFWWIYDYRCYSLENAHRIRRNLHFSMTFQVHNTHCTRIVMAHIWLVLGNNNFKKRRKYWFAPSKRKTFQVLSIDVQACLKTNDDIRARSAKQWFNSYPRQLKYGWWRRMFRVICGLLS